MPVEEIRYDIPDELTAGPAMTEEEKEAVAQKMKALDKLLSDKGLAKYKLEVMFVEDRSLHRPFAGAISWWESGSKLHGGGDSKLYLCDSVDPELAKRGCKKFIPDSANGLNFVVCPSCQMLWKNELIVGEMVYKLPVQKWADVLLFWFQKLELNADIRIKYARGDIRTAAMHEQERQRGGELLHRVRDQERRATAIYPLRNIIKDTSAGADLHSRILAFLRA